MKGQRKRETMARDHSGNGNLSAKMEHAGSLNFSPFLERECFCDGFMNCQKRQINIAEEEVHACPEEGRRASGERRSLKEVHHRNRVHLAPCSWDPVHPRRASGLANQEHPEVGCLVRRRDPCPCPAWRLPWERALDSPRREAVLPRSWRPRAHRG